MSSNLLASSAATENLGPILIGLTISAIIYGISVLQIYLYYTEFSSKDSLALKIVVALIFIIDSAQLALSIQTTYNFVVPHFGDSIYLAQIHGPTLACDMIGMLIVVLLDYCFAYRIYLLNGRKIVLPVIICVLSTTSFSCALVYMVQVYKVKFDALTTPYLPWFAAAVAGIFTAQILISSTLVYLLHRHKTPFPKTNKIMNRLIAYTINTSLLTAAMVLAALLSYLVSRSSSIYVIVTWIGVRVYGCSFLSMLNTRHKLRINARNDEPATQDFITLSHLGNDDSSSDAPTRLRSTGEDCNKPPGVPPPREKLI